MSWFTKRSKSDVENVWLGKEKKDGVYIRWKKMKEPYHLEIYRGAVRLQKLALSLDTTKHFWKCESSAVYSFKIKKQTTAMDQRQETLHGCVSLIAGPVLPIDWILKEENGGVVISGHEMPRTKFHLRIKINGVVMHMFQNLEILNSYLRGFKPKQVIKARIWAESAGSIGQPSRSARKKIKFRGILSVKYRIYYSATNVIVAFFLEGNNSQYEKNLDERFNTYTIIDNMTRTFSMKPKKNLKSKLEYEVKTEKIEIKPRNGHAVVYKDLLEKGCLEHSFIISRFTKESPSFVHRIAGKEAWFTLAINASRTSIQETAPTNGFTDIEDGNSTVSSRRTRASQSDENDQGRTYSAALVTVGTAHHIQVTKTRATLGGVHHQSTRL